MRELVIFFYFIYAFFSTLSCQYSGGTPGDETDSIALKSDTEETRTISNPLSDRILVIYGENIWVRDKAKTGKVIMTLNQGDTCKILERGELAVINGQPDYWYKVEFENNQGWLFGSQTDKTLFMPLNDSLKGRLEICNDELMDQLGAPAANSYNFEEEKSFSYMVAAGYSISGIYEQKGNILTLSSLSMSVETPDGKQINELKGSISFRLFTNNKVIFLGEKTNTLKDKTYAPAGGAFCWSR
jgi:hypothetical protein